jgi:hypothetical protein
MHSPDVHDLRDWKPESDEWAILIQLLVGPAGAPGEESFDVTLCTSGWLGRRAEDDGFIDGRHHVVVARYDYAATKQYFERRVSRCEGKDWPEVAQKVSRIGHWEFEDYSG